MIIIKKSDEYSLIVKTFFNISKKINIRKTLLRKSF